MKPNTKYESVPILELQIRTLQAKLEEIDLLMHSEHWTAYGNDKVLYHAVLEERRRDLAGQLKEITK